MLWPVYNNRAGSLPLPGYDHLGRKVLLVRPGLCDPNKYKVWNIFEKKNKQLFQIQFASEINSYSKIIVWAHPADKFNDDGSDGRRGRAVFHHRYGRSYRSRRLWPETHHVLATLYGQKADALYSGILPDLKNCWLFVFVFYKKSVNVFKLSGCSTHQPQKYELPSHSVGF